MTITDAQPSLRRHDQPLAEAVEATRTPVAATIARGPEVHDVIALLESAEEQMLELWSAQLATPCGMLLDVLVDSHRSVQRARLALDASR